METLDYLIIYHFKVALLMEMEQKEIYIYLLVLREKHFGLRSRHRSSTGYSFEKVIHYPTCHCCLRTPHFPFQTHVYLCICLFFGMLCCFMQMISLASEVSSCLISIIPWQLRHCCCETDVFASVCVCMCHKYWYCASI